MRKKLKHYGGESPRYIATQKVPGTLREKMCQFFGTFSQKFCREAGKILAKCVKNGTFFLQCIRVLFVCNVYGTFSHNVNFKRGLI